MNNPLTYKVVVMAALYFSFISMKSCFETDRSESNIKSYALAVNYPILWDKMELDNKKDTFPIFYYKNYCIYMIPYRYTMSLNEKPVANEKRYWYFIYRENEKQGYYYDNANDSTKSTNQNVDTFLLKYTCPMKFNTDGLKFISASMDKSNKTLLEKYLVPIDHDVYTPDSVYFYYDEKMNDCPYSFSKKMDSLKGKKVYSGRYLFNQRYSEADKATVPKREYYFTISEVPLKNKKKILELVGLFEATHGQHKTTHKD